MNVLVVEPGMMPYEKEVNGLEEMQDTVGEYIEAISPYDEMVCIVCDEEGLINGRPFNRSVEGGYGGVFGTFFVCGITEDNFCSLDSEQMKRYKEKFKNAEILLGVKGNEPITLKVPAMPHAKPHGKDKDEHSR